ncbi:MAG: CT583 family protein [Candidatus Rhabdochlamydia sp.]
MSKVNDLLSARLKQKSSKMGELATLSSRGDLSSFSGVFKIQPLSHKDEEVLKTLLQEYQIEEKQPFEEDFQNLSNLTSEIKAISSQAIILHGERIQKAQTILKNYRDGAFSRWLLSTYGNRQTPYNFLQYYEFYLKLTPSLQDKLEEIPRQAVYTLASRDVSWNQKQAFITSYKGETKHELLEQIRLLFPLEESDQRRENLVMQGLTLLQKLHQLIKRSHFNPNAEEKQLIDQKLESIQALLMQKKKTL